MFESSRPDIWMVWRCYGIKIFFFCFELTVRNTIWMRMTSVTVMVIFQKCHSGSYLITATFKVPSQQLWGTLTTAFWKTPCNWKWTWMNIGANSFNKTWENIMKQKSKKLPRKSWVAQKSEPELQTTLQQIR